jgi:hypothetical protein
MHRITYRFRLIVTVAVLAAVRAAAQEALRSGLAVEKRDAIPEQISSVRLQNKALWPIEQIAVNPRKLPLVG